MYCSNAQRSTCQSANANSATWLRQTFDIFLCNKKSSKKLIHFQSMITTQYFQSPNAETPGNVICYLWIFKVLFIVLLWSMIISHYLHIDTWHTNIYTDSLVRSFVTKIFSSWFTVLQNPWLGRWSSHYVLVCCTSNVDMFFPLL